MLVYSNEASGEEISFKFYNNETGSVNDINEIYTFESDMMVVLEKYKNAQPTANLKNSFIYPLQSIYV